MPRVGQAQQNRQYHPRLRIPLSHVPKMARCCGPIGRSPTAAVWRSAIPLNWCSDRCRAGPFDASGGAEGRSRWPFLLWRSRGRSGRMGEDASLGLHAAAASTRSLFAYHVKVLKRQGCLGESRRGRLRIPTVSRAVGVLHARCRRRRIPPSAGIDRRRPGPC